MLHTAHDYPKYIQHPSEPAKVVQSRDEHAAVVADDPNWTPVPALPADAPAMLSPEAVEIARLKAEIAFLKVQLAEAHKPDQAPTPPPLAPVLPRKRVRSAKAPK